jgi:hypothetical protein
MSDKIILKQGVINFFFKKEEFKSLSNFWECIIIIKDEEYIREYHSGESCFHGEKFIRVSKLCKNENRKKELLKYGSKFLSGVCKENGVIVKKMGRKLILNKDELDLWYTLSIGAQNGILTNYKELLKKNNSNYKDETFILDTLIYVKQ